MIQHQYNDCAVLYNVSLLLLDSGLIDPPIALLVMHECCMGNAAVGSEHIRHAVASGMRLTAFLLAAKVCMLFCVDAFFVIVCE